MHFISRDKGRKIVARHADIKLQSTVQGMFQVEVKPAFIIFRPMRHGGWKTSALPQMYGREMAEGEFDSSRAKMRPGLTEHEADEFLLKHKDYGIDFVAMDDDGKPIAASDWDRSTKRSEPFLSPSGKGVYCELCEKQLDGRGMHKHLESNAHMTLLAEAEQKQVAKTRGARA